MKSLALVLFVAALAACGGVAFRPSPIADSTSSVARDNPSAWRRGSSVADGGLLTAPDKEAAESVAPPTALPASSVLPPSPLVPTTLRLAAEKSLLPENSSLSGGERWIDVDLSKQTLTAYDGAATARTFVISSGAPGYETVTGHFKIYQKHKVIDLYGPDFFQPAVPFVMMFYPHFALHAATWHDDFGKPVSHGCINLRLADAAWLYSWAPIGTRVEIVHWH